MLSDDIEGGVSKGVGGITAVLYGATKGALLAGVLTLAAMAAVPIVSAIGAALFAGAGFSLASTLTASGAAMVDAVPLAITAAKIGAAIMGIASIIPGFTKKEGGGKKTEPKEKSSPERGPSQAVSAGQGATHVLHSAPQIQIIHDPSASQQQPQVVREPAPQQQPIIIRESAPQQPIIIRESAPQQPIIIREAAVPAQQQQVHIIHEQAPAMQPEIRVIHETPQLQPSTTNILHVVNDASPNMQVTREGGPEVQVIREGGPEVKVFNQPVALATANADSNAIAESQNPQFRPGRGMELMQKGDALQGGLGATK